jgi:hypothetical protein
VSSPSGVQPVRCPVRPLSGYLASSSGRGWPAGWCPARPASGRLVSARLVSKSVRASSRLLSPVALSHPSRPASASGSDGGPGTAGQRSRRDQVEFHVSGPIPGGSVDGPMRQRCGHRCGGRVKAGGGASAGGPGPGGASAGGCGRPTRQARRPRGAPVGGDCARQGLADAMLPHGTVWSGHLAWSRDYAAWSVRSLMSEWTGLEEPNELGGQDGARPQRGPVR